jgi:SAM-dependent methyltransferase
MKIHIVIFLVICICLSNCKNNSNSDSKSDDSMQPYDGYPMLSSKDSIEQFLKGRCIDTIKFKKGEIIADIGAGNGYLEAMLSIFNDSLTFFIQDIDTSVCNQKKINEVVNFYQDIIGRPFTNKFLATQGADNETNLPNDTLDKIFMLWTYQYFKNPKAIMTDLKFKLKNDGLMYIINPNIDYESSKQLTSEHGWNASPIEKEISDIIGCGFELVQISRNNYCCELPYIIVFKKKNHFN